MRRRCTDKNYKAYKYYGGRGIKVCDEWQNIQSFINWAKNFNYQGLQLDRIDNDEGYSPENCHFVEQVMNKRKQRGHKLNLSVAEEVRKLYKVSDNTITNLAQQYNVSWQTIYGIIQNRYYSPTA